MPSDRCRHGMDARYCGFCHPQPKRPNRALSAAKPAKSKANDSGDYFVLRSNPQKADFNRLGRGIKTVCPKPSELTREQRLYLIWKMGSVERVNWDSIRLDPLGFKTDPEKRHFLSKEGDRDEYLRTRRIGTGWFSYWLKQPPIFPILDQLLEEED